MSWEGVKRHTSACQTGFLSCDRKEINSVTNEMWPNKKKQLKLYKKRRSSVCVIVLSNSYRFFSGIDSFVEDTWRRLIMLAM